jgi:hypothetical protein
MAKKDRVERLKELIKEMDTLMGELADDYGAYDSEPDAEFQHVLVQAAIHDKIEVPENAAEWQIFTSVPGHERAARRMTSKANKIAKWLKNNNVVAVQNHVREYCWRISC